MFSKSARLYDVIYQDRIKDYAAEVPQIRELIQARLKSGGKSLLDVASGTGQHLYYLRDCFDVEGLDLDEGLLEVARERLPGVPLHQGDMVNFDLGKQFDVITCLFSSIGYVQTVERMQKALSSMTRHLKPGGVLLLEPWFTPEQWHPGGVHAVFVDQPDLKVARMNVSGVKGTLSFFEFHYLVGSAQGVEHFTELHELGLFTHEEYLQAFEFSRLRVTHDPKGLDGRGLYIGTKES